MSMDFKPRRRFSVSLPVLLLLLLPPVYILFMLSAPLLGQPRCDYSIIYNKPHKTAGTKIQNDIVGWAKKSRWTAVTCSPFEPNLQLQECVRENRAGCVIVANHMVLTPQLERLLRDRLGTVKYMTSTRSGRERRLSHFLQMHRVKHNTLDPAALKQYLKGANPWSDYNYMTGEGRTGKCPVTWGEQQIISQMVSKYDIVIDADIPGISNVILKHFGLFQLSEERVNVKGANEIRLDGEGERLVEMASCVDEEMHRQFRVRMGSLYEMITGVPCNNFSRGAAPCF